MQRKVRQKDKNRALRSLLNNPGIIVSLGVHDAFSALIAQRAGMNLLFLGGFGVSASRFGLPDLNFLNLSDMELAVQQITRQLSIPLIADGDTGHGDLPHVRQTVERLAAAGASGILLEDQLFPKRCGHFHQKQIITKEEMLEKIQVAVDSRPDEDFVIIARTGTRALNGLEDAIDRVNAYCKCGADVAFIEAPERRAELEEIVKKVPYPLFANMLVGGKTPILSVSDLERLGFKFAVSPIETLMVCGSAMQSMLEAFKQSGQLSSHLEDKMSFETLKDILNLDGQLSTQSSRQ